MDLDRYTRSRRSLHGLAEGLLSGPQYLTSGTIRMRVIDGAIATVAAPDVRYLNNSLVIDGRSIDVTGSFGELASAAGLQWSVPSHYSDHSGITADDIADIDPADGESIISWFTLGRDAMESMWPDTTPVLWPEHFDLGISVAEVNYGISPGDDFHAAPYAYVGPWAFADWTDKDPFWNAPFGVVRSAAELENSEAITNFFTVARSHIKDSSHPHDPVAQ